MSKEDKDLANDSLEDDTDLEDDSGSDNSAPPKPASASGDNSETRINDLMGKWQAEQARANKLQRELDARGTGQPAQGSQETGSGDGDASAAQSNEFLEFAREDARRRVFEADPRLAAYGLDVSSISGSTLGEMKESFKRQKALVEGIESRARAAVLQEHGLDPEVVAGSHERLQGISEMSDEKFAQLLEERDAHKFG